MIVAGAPAAAQVKSQYSVEDIERSLGACDDPQLTMGADGTCRPRLGNERGFALSRAKPAEATITKPAKKASRSSSSNRFALAPRPKGVNLLINFANASDQLTPQAQANAQVLARALTSPQLSGVRIAIDGHTNAVGDRAYNQRLSQARADALAEYLVKAGVDRSRLEVHGYGFDRPLDARNPRGGANRRVEGRRIDQAS